MRMLESHGLVTVQRISDRVTGFKLVNSPSSLPLKPKADTSDQTLKAFQQKISIANLQISADRIDILLCVQTVKLKPF